MKEITLKITAKDGLHARPASNLCKEIAKYAEQIDLIYKGRKVNMKSTLGIMSLAIPSGSEITVCVTGRKEDEVSQKIITLFEDLNLTT